jgi:V/A-type H+-transporting ATPase subunit E
MSRSALIESLRRAAAEERAAAWQEARAASAAATAEAEQSVAAEKARLEAECAQAALRLEREGASRARIEARRARMAATRALAERMGALARAELARVRDVDNGPLFRALVAELPDRGWQSVAVNPADATLAVTAFPSARIDLDPTIIGGFRAATADGRIQVSNTLDTRLERAWPDLLPQLISAVFHDPTSRPTAA